MGVTGLLETGKPGEKVIVDGLNGCLLLDPDADDLATYEERQREYQEWEARTRSESHWPAEMRDGVRVSVHANLERLEEMDELQDSGAEGVGLYRTEFSFLREHLPSEEGALCRIQRRGPQGRARACGLPYPGRRCGQDAPRPGGPQGTQPGPGPARHPLLPAAPKDLPQPAARPHARRGGRQYLPAAAHDLRPGRGTERAPHHAGTAAGAAGRRSAPRRRSALGIMVETPAAVLIADALARECDFFSIGTNDLIHYLMAIDRNNLHVGYLNEALHPAVVRSLKRIIDSAHREGIGVSVCGELAADPYGLALLLGMGVDTLSASPRFVPGMKHMIRRLDAQTCMDMAHSVLMSTDVTASQRMLRERLQESLGSELAFHTTSIMTNS